MKYPDLVQSPVDEDEEVGEDDDEDDVEEVSAEVEEVEDKVQSAGPEAAVVEVARVVPVYVSSPTTTVSVT